MATYDITLNFNTRGMKIEIDNTDHTLSYTELGSTDIDYTHPSGIIDRTVHPVQVSVLRGGEDESNPNPLVFQTSITKLASGGKIGHVYCMTSDAGIPKIKKRRLTDVTVSSGGGFTPPE